MKTSLIEEKVLIAILAAQVSLVCLGVLSRYYFNWSISFTEELTRYLLIWLACLGFPACWARQEMIQFSTPWPKSQRYASFQERFRYIICLVYLIVLGYAGFKRISLQWAFHSKTSVMGWPMIWVSIAIPVMCLLFIWRMTQSKKP